MNYRVIFQPRALADLEEQYQYIAGHNLTAAVNWFNNFVESLEGLSIFPQRCPIARESEQSGREIRQFLYGKRAGMRRAYFVIEDDTVRILCIRHAAQRDIPLEDLLGL
jgi:plasmid stabilization system protein ParE